MNHQSVEFRQALGSFATGVTVVTAAGADGAMAGVTANSFTSVSLEPPLILWCLANTSDSLAVFREAAYFAVNILASGQVRLSDHFARRQEDKFSEVRFRRGRGGAPLLEGCVTWLQCRTAAQHDMGDHRVFVGEVVGFETSWEEALLFHRGSYGISLPLPGDDEPEGGWGAAAEIMPLAFWRGGMFDIEARAGIVGYTSASSGADRYDRRRLLRLRRSRPKRPCFSESGRG